MVLAMHAGFAFLEVGTVRQKNQVNALVKIIAERARFYPMLIGAFFTVGVVYPFFEGIVWNGNFGFQDWLEATFGAGFHDFAGSVVVALLGLRNGRYRGGRLVAFAPSNIPLLALGAWILTIGWFGFNVMSAQTMDGISGLVAVNTLMAMVGGIVTSLFVGKNDPGFIHNGPLAGLVAVCAGSDLMHPVGALVTGGNCGRTVCVAVYLYAE